MNISLREMVLILVTLGVALFGGTALLGRSRYEEWKAIRRDQVAVREEQVLDERLLESRERLNAEFEALRQYLPQHPADKKMDIHWMSVMDGLAAQHGVRITRRQAGDEERVGDIYELPIEVRDWESTLESLVRFLFELQNQGAMLDIRQLSIKPNEQKVLRGRFLLYCAYTRDAPVSVAVEAGGGN